MNKNIGDIDVNLKFNTDISREGFKFYSPEEEPFKLYGVTRMGDRFRRLPTSVAKATSEGVEFLHAHTAGGRVRFVTNSKRFILYAKLDNLAMAGNSCFEGNFGFDLYTGADYRLSFIPPVNITEKKEYESLVELPDADGSGRLITVNMPNYCDVLGFSIGLEEGATVSAAPDYEYEKPIVYYGSSITQGGCASRPGRDYQNIICRRFDTNYINLGFSGSAKGEQTIGNYIAGLDMSLFVLDYDHNAPTNEHLEATHEKFFKLIREKRPELDILILSRPKAHLEVREQQRLEIITRTYENAVKGGDKHVFMIDGPTLMRYAGYEGTVDNCHPNDLGFESMGKVIGDFLDGRFFKSRK